MRCAATTLALALLGCGCDHSSGLEVAGGDDAARKPGRYALLVGCTRYPNLAHRRWLEGPGNDVVILRTLLEQTYHFPTSNITTLAEGVGTEQSRPTRANIEREFRRLAETAGMGDRVVILLSGHGSQQPDQWPPDPADPEPDGLDETFLPADIGAWDGGRQRVVNAIVDDDLGRWVGAITARGASVWVVVDACHAGTMIRGGDEEVLRKVPAEALIPPESLQAARDRAARLVEKPRGSSDVYSPIDLPAGSPHLVALYAAQPDEPAVEKHLPIDTPGSKFHGLLTYTLCRVLAEAAEARSPLTYRQLAGRVQGQYRAWGRVYPTPLVEGEGQGRVVLGDDSPDSPRISLQRRANGWEVDAGSLLGLSPGSILAVHPEAGRTGADHPLGYVRVMAEGLRPFGARVEPSASPDGLIPALANLPEGGQCRLAYLDLGDLRLKVAVDSSVGLVAERDLKGPTSPSLAARQVQHLERLLDTLAGQPDAPVRAVKRPVDADWLIRAAGPEADRVYLVPASGGPSGSVAGDGTVVLGPFPSDGAILGRRVAQVARVRNILRIAGESRAFTDSEPSGGLQVEMLRFTGKADRVGVTVALDGEFPKLSRGDLVAFRLTNPQRSSKLDVTLLNLNAGFGIEAVFPRGGTSNRLSPGESTMTGRFEVDASPPGLEQLVVITMKPREDSLMADFTFLAEPTIERARGDGLVRGDVNRGIDSPLGRLLQNGVFATGITRGLPIVREDEGSIRTLGWVTRK